MLEEATAKGVANEKTMWASVTAVDSLLAKLEDAHPDVYWDFIRDQHELIYGGHYSEEFADYDFDYSKGGKIWKVMRGVR